MYNSISNINISLPIINLSKGIFTPLKLRNPHTVFKLQQTFTNIKTNKVLLNIKKKSCSSKSKIFKTKLINKGKSIINKEISHSSLNLYKQYSLEKKTNSKKLQFLKEILSNNLFLKNDISEKEEIKNLIKSKKKNSIQIKYSSKVNAARHKSCIIKSINSKSIIEKLSKKINEEKEREEEKNEKIDKVNNPNIEDIKLLKKAKAYLSKLNYNLKVIPDKIENYFKIKENQINYIEDYNKLPFFKNNFVKLKGNDTFFRTIPNNTIKHDIFIYLNKLRKDYQNQIDEELQNKNENKNDGEENLESELDRILILNNNLINFDEAERAKYNFKKENEYIVENYLNLKFSKFHKTQISNIKDRKAIFSLFKTKNKKLNIID